MRLRVMAVWSPRRATRTTGSRRPRSAALVHIIPEAALALAVLGAAFAAGHIFGTPEPFPLPPQAATATAAAAARQPVTATAAGGHSPAPSSRPRQLPRSQPPWRTDQGVAEVAFLGSGAARTTLVVSGSDAAVLDGGTPAVDAALVAQLHAAGIDQLTAAVFTGGHGATGQGLVPLLHALPVARIIVPGQAPDPALRDLLATARSARIPVSAASRGTTLSVGAARLTWLWPPLGLGQPSDGGTRDSALIRVEVGRVGILLAGTFDPKAEDALVRLDSAGALRSQVLEVPAGGAAGSLTAPFLQAVAPHLALIFDRSDAPAEGATVQQLAAAGAVLVHADRWPDLTVTTDGHRLTVGFAAIVQPASAAPASSS